MLSRGRLRRAFRLGTGALRSLRLLDDNLALEDMHLDILGRSDLDGKLRSQVNDRALGSLDLKPRASGFMISALILPARRKTLLGATRSNLAGP